MLIQSLKETFRLLFTSKRLWLPFLFACVFEIGFIVLLWLAPHKPFDFILAPPIRYFASEQMLHYPWHLFFLWLQMPHVHTLSMILLGAYMSGIASIMVAHADDSKVFTVRDAVLSKKARYIRLMILWIVSWIVAQIMMRILGQLPEILWLRIVASFVLMIVVQSFLVYAIPAAIFEGVVWWKALWRGVKTFFKNPITTVGFVFVPSLIIMLFSILFSQMRVWEWMQAYAPEWVFACIALRLVVWLVADAFMTVCAAKVWLKSETHNA